MFSNLDMAKKKNYAKLSKETKYKHSIYWISLFKISYCIDFLISIRSFYHLGFSCISNLSDNFINKIKTVSFYIELHCPI